MAFGESGRTGAVALSGGQEEGARVRNFLMNIIGAKSSISGGRGGAPGLSVGAGGGGGGDRPVAGDHESARSAASGLGRGASPAAFPDGSSQSPLAPPPDLAFL